MAEQILRWGITANSTICLAASFIRTSRIVKSPPRIVSSPQNPAN